MIIPFPRSRENSAEVWINCSRITGVWDMGRAILVKIKDEETFDRFFSFRNHSILGYKNFMSHMPYGFVLTWGMGPFYT